MRPNTALCKLGLEHPAHIVIRMPTQRASQKHDGVININASVVWNAVVVCKDSVVGRAVDEGDDLCAHDVAVDSLEMGPEELASSIQERSVHEEPIRNMARLSRESSVSEVGAVGLGHEDMGDVTLLDDWIVVLFGV